MRVLITGSHGQLGTELMALLAGDDHHEVWGLDLPEHDLTDRDHVLGVLTTWRPDVIVHAAAMTAVDRCEREVELAQRVNCLATRFVADGARRVGAHVLYVSTDYVFDGTKDTPYVEWDTPNPQSVYGRTKLGGEREIDPGWTIARTSWVCGEHGPNMVRTLLRLAEGGDEVRFVEDQRGHPTFTSDLAPMLASPPWFFVGGPVAVGGILALGRRTMGVEASHVTDVAGPIVMVEPEALINGEVQGLDVVRLFTGYSGWAPGQLDAELTSGAWHVVRALPDDVFCVEPEQLWRSVMRRQGGRLASQALFPDDVSVN